MTGKHVLTPSWPADVCEDYEERAAIMQFDGGMSRAQAELEARALIERRLNPPAPVQQDFGAADDEGGRFWAEMERLYGGRYHG